MSNLTKCNGTDCPLKKKCRRYLERKEGQDWYFMYPPYVKELKKCKHFKQKIEKLHNTNSNKCWCNPKIIKPKGNNRKELRNE